MTQHGRRPNRRRRKIPRRIYASLAIGWSIVADMVGERGYSIAEAVAYLGVVMSAACFFARWFERVRDSHQIIRGGSNP